MQEAPLPPGDSAGACKEAQEEESLPAPPCPVPNPGAFPGGGLAPCGSGASQAERPQEQVAAFSRPRCCTASLGRAGAAPAAGAEGGTEATGAAEGLCKGQSSPRCSLAPGSKEICEGTYQRLDSLEETIRELELTIHEISSHPLAEFVFPKELLGQAGPEDACEKTEEGLGDLKRCSWDSRTALDLSQAKGDAPWSPSPSRTKPPLLPKPQPPHLTAPQVYVLLSLLPCSAPDSLWCLSSSTSTCSLSVTPPPGRARLESGSVSFAPRHSDGFGKRRQAGARLQAAEPAAGRLAVPVPPCAHPFTQHRIRPWWLSGTFWPGRFWGLSTLPVTSTGLGDKAASLGLHKRFSNERQFERGSCFS